MVDLLRTACFVLTKDFVREYTKDTRSVNAQVHSATCNTLREERIAASRAAYATGDQMSQNFDNGLAALNELSLKSNDALRDVLVLAWADVSTSITSLLLPMILDGRRMKAFNAISSRFYGFAYSKKGPVYGSEGLLSELFDSNSSITSVSRVVKTILSVMAMARLHIVSFYIESGSKVGKSEKQARKEAKESAEWAEVSAFVKALSGVVGKHLPIKDASGGSEGIQVEEPADASKSKDAKDKKQSSSAPKTNRLLYDTIANWFECAIRDSGVFTVLSSAFMYRGFAPGRINGKLKEAWDEFTDGEEADGFGLWEIASFLVSTRLNLHKNDMAGSNILMCAMVCLSGAVGDLMTDKADGPFVFTAHIKKHVNLLYDACFGHTRLKTSKIASRRHAKAVFEGKTCRATSITRNIYIQGYSRRQHDKTSLMDSRLAISLFMLSFTEEIKKDLFSGNECMPRSKSHVSPLVYEGRKDGRRIYTVALQSVPCVNYTVYRKGAASHLIEKNRVDPDKVTTTADNTEKPFRDIVGGAVMSTLLYPLSGKAFEYTVMSLVDEHSSNGLKNPKWKNDPAWFKSKTNACVNKFIKNLRKRAAVTFDVTKLDSDGPGPVRVGASNAKAVMLQQLSFLNKFCDVIENNGALWEDLQLSFSVQPPSKMEQKELNCDYESGEDEDDVHDDTEDSPTPAKKVKRKAASMSSTETLDKDGFPSFGDDDDDFD